MGNVAVVVLVRFLEATRVHGATALTLAVEDKESDSIHTS
jgi:hypothetical protein